MVSCSYKQDKMVRPRPQYREADPIFNGDIGKFCGCWKPFYGADLITYAGSRGNPAPNTQDIGLLMEQIFYDWAAHNFFPRKHKFRHNSGKIQANDNSVPDFISDNAFSENRMIYRERASGEKVNAPETYLEAANIFEVKASRSGIYLSSNDWQMAAHITNQARRLQKHIDKGFVPITGLATTWDVKFSQKIAFHALLNGIDYFHFRAQFRVLNGVYEFNFGYHNLADGDTGFR